MDLIQAAARRLFIETVSGLKDPARVWEENPGLHLAWRDRVQEVLAALSTEGPVVVHEGAVYLVLTAYTDASESPPFTDWTTEPPPGMLCDG